MLKSFITSIICLCIFYGVNAQDATSGQDVDKTPEKATATEKTLKNDDETVKSTDESKPEVVSKPEKDRLPIITKLKDIVDILDKKYPQGLHKFNKEQTDLFINQFLNTLGSGLHFSYEIKDNKSEEKDKDSKSDVYSAVIIAANRVLYVRIDEFNDKSFEQLKGDCLMSAALSKKPFGIILDLRNCQGNDLSNALKCLSLICPANELPDYEGKKDVKQLLDTPCTALIGKQTAGAAEVFIHLLKDARKCLTIGRDTSGELFPSETIKLDSGGYLKVPNIPEFYENLDLKAVKPDINVDAYPQLEYNDISGKIGSENHDKCLLRATDLIICIHTLKSTQKKGQKNE